VAVAELVVAAPQLEGVLYLVQAAAVVVELALLE